MLTIKKEDVKNTFIIDLYGRLHSIKDKIHSFEKEYKKSFIEFEKDVLANKERYHDWDSYIEWKGYVNALEDVQHKIEDVKRGNFKIA